MNCDFCFSKLLIYCILIVSELVVVVKFRYGVGLGDIDYGHAEYGNNMCFMSTNKQAIC